MNPQLDEKAVEEINRILKNGNKVVIQRRKDDIIIMEETRKIKYTTERRSAQ